MTEEYGNAVGRKLWETRRWLVVAPFLLLFWIIGQFDKANISLVIADKGFLEELHLVGRNTELGSLMSVFFFGYGGAVFVWGFLVDRFGPRRCLMVGSVCWGSAMFMMSQATTFEGLLVARFLLGVAEGNMWPVSNALTNRWFPTREHSRAQTFWLTGSTLGTAVAIPIVTALMLAFDWRAMMVALAVLSLIPIILFSFVANRPAEQKRLDPREVREIEQGQVKTAAVERMSFRELLKSGEYWLIAAGMVVSSMTVFTLIQWIPSFLVSQRHLSFITMSRWITVGYMVSTGVTIGGGVIGDRTMQRARTAAWTCTLIAVTVVPGALLLPARGSAVFLAALIGGGAVSAALNGALLHSMVRPEAVARGTGIYTGVGNFLSAFGPAVFGALIQTLDGAYWGGFLFVGLMNLASAACYFALHRISVRSRLAAAGLRPIPAAGSNPTPLPEQ